MTRRRSTLALLATVFAQCLLLPLATAQGTTGTGNLIPSTIPACAKQCGVLMNAAGSCATNPASAQSCFCQSALLTPLKTSPNNVCAPGCTDADFGKIAAWYKSTCANGGTTSSSSGQSGNTGNTAAAASPTTTPTSSGSNAQINQNLSGSQWWSTHWQWIVMVLVLAIAFTAIGVGGRIWYRRRHKKVDGEIVEVDRQSSAPDMAQWAPARHSVHDIGGQQSRARPESTITPLPARRSTNKGKSREGAPPLGRSHSQRLVKAMRDVQM